MDDYISRKDTEVQPIKRGMWMYELETDAFHCTKCNGLSDRDDYRFCPWCGALMENQEVEK